MLHSPLSLQISSTSRPKSNERSTLSPENTSKRNNLLQLPSNISSLYEADPTFSFPAIRYHLDPSNRWESIAKEILTPFAPKYPIYNFKKFVPKRHQIANSSTFEGMTRAFSTNYPSLQVNMSPIASPSENKNFQGSRLLASRKVSFAGNSRDGQRSDQKSYRKFLSGSQTLRLEFSKLDDPKKTFLKKFLTTQSSPRNLLVENRQAQDKARDRPQSAAGSLLKHKPRTMYNQNNRISFGIFSEEVSKQEKDSSDSISQVDTEIRDKPLCVAKRFILAIKAAKGSPRAETPSSSRRSFAMSERAFVRPGSFLREKSKENSFRNDSKISLLSPRVGEEENNKELSKKEELALKSSLKNSIRRKSDTSKYSGGECLKLTKHSDIILPSDHIKRSAPRPQTSEKKEDPMIKFLAKKKLDLEPRREQRKSIVVSSPRNSIFNTLQLETFNSNQPLKVSESDFRLSDFSMHKKTQESNNGLRLSQSPSLKDKRPPKLIMSPVGSSPTRAKQIFGLDELSASKYSLTPGARSSQQINSDSTTDRKIEQCETTRSLKRQKVSFEKRLKQGDLSEALKIVLNLNKKAEKTVFRKKSSETLKSLGPSFQKSFKVESKQSSKTDLDKEREMSPYVRSTLLKNNEVKALLMPNTERKKETTAKPIKKKANKRKNVVFSLRSQSVPKITKIPALEKAYS